MARKIKLPLDMGNDIKVRDIDELKENYNSEKVVEYFLSGELLSWLNDRFYDEEAERVEALFADKDSGNVAGKLAEIFGVQIEGEVDVDEIAERKERLERLRKITSDDEVLRNVDLVAFSQEDMDIVHESDVIYLCGEKFRIPYSVQNKRYIGVNDPLVEISAKGNIDLDSKGIVIEGCRFTEETEARIISCNKQAEIIEEPIVENTQPVADGIFGEIYNHYSPKGAKGDLASFERLDFNKKYIDSIGLGFRSDYKDSMLELYYENMYIYIPADDSFYLEGQALMKFKNCVIHMGSRENQKSDVVHFTYKFNGVFSNCTFILDECGLDKSKIAWNNSLCLFNIFARERINVSFNDCLFIHANYLIKASVDKSPFTISFKKCHFINCYEKICIYGGIYDDTSIKISVNDCAICQDGGDMSFNTHFSDIKYEDFSSLSNMDERYMKKFVYRIQELIMFPLNDETFVSHGLFNIRTEYLLSANGNMIMQPKTLEYLKEIVQDEWKKHGIDIDEFNWDTEYEQPKIFPSNSELPVKNTKYADPSDREALDKFFGSKSDN